MTVRDVLYLFNNPCTKNFLVRKIGHRLCDKLICLLWLQKAYFERLHVDEISRPARTHFAERVRAAEKQRKLRVMLDDCAKPIKHEREVDRACTTSFCQLLKF